MGGGTDRLERVGALVAFLLDKDRPVSRAELEDRFDEYSGPSGRRRFEDDKAALRRAGLPLRVLGEGVDARYQLRRDEYELAPLELDDGERLALHLAVRSVRFTSVPWGAMVETKLGIDPAESVAVMAELPGMELLPLLSDAVARARVVRFAYRGEERVVEPWGVVLKHGRWYLVGHDRLRVAPRNFRVDRIDPGTLSLEEAEPVTTTAPADIGSLIADDPKLMAPGDGELARLRVDRRIAWLVGGDPCASEDAGTDEIVVEVPVTHTGAFVAWVLGFGELVVVEHPPALRRAVTDRLVELAGPIAAGLD